ncbi:putative membrane protein [Clostridium argentinense CDC 2741]|uniref:Uncharacterized protein n=2 Tax=Clostridium argentinense TaxID=29341 RepID=A0A7I6N2X3_9CLOT|nr:hypothetical protein [Clostridium argentinense]ARC83106.1 hypothetical protein RSJ17_00185 [Clostridium argentinense]KIE44891.1 putative membrane protein [Clostridium argentinense CDC 2741]NFF41342.1 hypothetical protein [Clostridium argentinense]NFP51763.1 hypothetical protein [Clostridium argentinense]NFP74267.1 hypothetical protein [Clostridium argentinense]
MNSQVLFNIIRYMGLLVTFFSIVILCYQLIIFRKKPEKRTESMKGFLNIAIGLLIIGNTLTISSFLLNTREAINIEQSIERPVFDDVKNSFEEDKGNFIEKALAGLLNSVNDFVLGSENKEGIAKKLLGFENLSELFFDKTSISLSGISDSKKSNNNNSVGPLSEKEWNICMSVYYSLLALTIPFIIVMVGKTGIMYIYNSTSTAKLEEVKEDIKRWVFVIILLAISFVFVEIFFKFITAISDMFYAKFSSTIKSSPIMGASKSWDSLKSGSLIITAILKFLYCGLYLKINAAFIARKWVLIIMLSLSPIIFCLWGINKKVQIFDIWIGEIITNAVMGLTYGIVFTIISLFIVNGTNIIMLIIGMKMAVQLAETLRNGLQGFFTRMAGINEMKAGIGGLGAASDIVAGAFNVFRTSGSKGNILNNSVPDTFSNVFKNNTDSNVPGGGASTQSIGRKANIGQSLHTNSNGSGNTNADSNIDSMLPNNDDFSNSFASELPIGNSTNSFADETPINSSIDSFTGETPIGNSVNSLSDETSIGSSINSFANGTPIGSSANSFADETSIGSPINSFANGTPIGSSANSFADEASIGSSMNSSAGGTSMMSSMNLNKKAPHYNGTNINSPNSKMEPNLNAAVNIGGQAANLKGREAVDYMKTKIGEDQEFANVLNQKYNQYKSPNFANGVGNLLTGGDSELKNTSKNITSIASGFSNTVAMGRALYSAGNHIASQRNGGKATFKESLSTANEMLRGKDVKMNDNNTIEYNQGGNVSGMFRGTRLVASAIANNEAKIGKILVNNSMQSNLNKTYTDWSQIGKIQSS